MFRAMISEGAQASKKAAEDQRLKEEFEAMEKGLLGKMKDADLAAWQARYPRDSAQSLLADQSWKIRLARKSALYSLGIGLLCAALGLAGGYLLGRANPAGTQIPHQEAKQPEDQRASHDLPPQATQPKPGMGKEVVKGAR